MIEFFINLLHLAASWKITFLLCSIAICLIAFLWNGKRIVKKLTVTLAVYALLNCFVGHAISGYLIYKYGTQGSGIISGYQPTNNQYNYRTVILYSAIIKTADGAQVPVEFESDWFNIYPSNGQEYTYPAPGVPFTVHYLHINPQAFVIIANVPGK